MPEEFFNPKPGSGSALVYWVKKSAMTTATRKIISSPRPSAATFSGYRSVRRWRLEWEFPRGRSIFAATFAARRPTDPGPALRQQIRKAYVERIAALELSIPSEVRMDRRTTVGQRD